MEMYSDLIDLYIAQRPAPVGVAEHLAGL